MYVRTSGHGSAVTNMSGRTLVGGRSSLVCRCETDLLICFDTWPDRYAIGSLFGCCGHRSMSETSDMPNWHTRFAYATALISCI